MSALHFSYQVSSNESLHISNMIRISMMTSLNGNISALLALCEGIHQSPVDSSPKGQWRGALVFPSNVRLNKRLSKHSRRQWFETPWRSLWRHCNLVFEAAIAKKYNSTRISRVILIHFSFTTSHAYVTIVLSQKNVGNWLVSDCDGM